MNGKGDDLIRVPTLRGSDDTIEEMYLSEKDLDKEGDVSASVSPVK